jgi:alcohol dehydrogenase
MTISTPSTMMAWRLTRLGGDLTFEAVPLPKVRPGTILVKVEASTLMSYIKPYVEGQLPPYHAPDGAFTPGGNCVGIVEKVGRDVWQLRPGQRVLLSSLFRSVENVPDPAQLLIGVTSFGPTSERVQADWPDGSLAEYALLPASSVVPADGFDDMPAERLIAAARFVVPYGGLVRGRLAAGETLIVNGASGAYGGAAVLVAVAMGAGRVIAAGRNREKLDALTKVAGQAVVPVALTGDVQTDAVALRKAAGGGAEIAFDMVGGAQDPHSTLAALHALRREGRLVLMGSLMGDLPVPYLDLMLNGIEIIGHFMHKTDAFRNILALVRAGRLDLGAIKPTVYPLIDLIPAMDAAGAAGSLEQIVMRS